MNLESISPLDSRYFSKIKELIPLMSEKAFIKKRIFVEIYYLEFILNILRVQEKEKNKENIAEIKKYISENSIYRIFEIEKVTNHDVKAIEYYIREVLKEKGLSFLEPYVHYGLTSQDVNSLALSIQIKETIKEIIIPELSKILDTIENKSKLYEDWEMCGHTHGQISSPTTVGKELKVFSYRLKREIDNLILITKKITSKFGGATGNFRAHYFTYKNIEWKEKIKEWIKFKFDIEISDYTTQIDNYESYSEIFDCICRINRILINFSRDIWLYGMKKYIKMEKKEHEIGSSAMPHKINPIQFEHCEGVLMLANNMGHFFSDKLPTSRLQRDLTDSVVLRFLGEFFAMSLDGYKSLIEGLSRLTFSRENILEDINKNYCELISEAVQMTLRKNNVDFAYEKVKFLMRGNNLKIEEYQKWINENFDKNLKEELLRISPRYYLGLE